ncbi:MAG: nucleotide pyrophosphohydrolase [Muribaculaceae bacterium]|nr:nucleotide pyrophosphohydrolase [Muribaculaceae bacterium]
MLTAEQTPSLAPLQRLVDSWIMATGKGYFSPLTNMAILAEETGEVARIMARLHGDQVAKPSDTAVSLADELVDVIWVATAIANQEGIDLTEALRKNFDKKSSRDADRFGHAAQQNTETLTPKNL